MFDELTCPHCKADLRDGEIPKKDRKYFGAAKYFSRLMGIEDDTYDGISWWCCPDCKVVWNRFSGEINTTIQDEEWFKNTIGKK